MSEANTPVNGPSKSGRNAMLAAGGAVLVGVGLAAGLMIRSHTASPSGDLDKVATGAGPQASAVQQPADDNARYGLAPKSAPLGRHRAEGMESSSRHDGVAEDLPSRHAVACPSCGVIEGVRPVQRRAEGTGIGALTGGVLGGLVGTQVGKGNGRTAATVLGAIGGGLAGNEVEKRYRTETVYEVRVRMDDGSLRTFTERTEPAPGTRVQVDNHGVHAIGNREPDGYQDTMRTSAGGNT